MPRSRPDLARTGGPITASAISAVTRLTLAAALALGACSGRPASYLRRLRIDLGAANTPAAQLAEARDLALALSAGRLAVREGAGAVSEICVGPR